MTTESFRGNRGSGRINRKVTVTETATLRLAESAMSNYRNSEQAILELVDNGVDNQSENQALTIQIRTNINNTLLITNQGGEGLDLEGFQNFLLWGISKKGAGFIGQYGAGGKAAMGFLGNSIDIIASAKGSNLEYHFNDPEWGSKFEGSSKQHEIEERTTDNLEGYFTLRITDLKRKIDKNTNQSLIIRLGDIYRPLLDRGKVKIYVNGTAVPPLEIKYLEGDPNFTPERVRLSTGWGDRIEAKVGILEEGQKFRSGLRLFYRGRLIKDGVFPRGGYPAQIPQASRLIGEAHLDHLDVTMNKSDFIEDVKWEDAIGVLENYLEPWYAKLATLKIETSHELKSYEKDLAKRAKRALEDILAKTLLITKAQMPGSSTGRRPPSTSEIEPPTPTGRTRVVEKEIEGETAPTIEATKAPNYPRWGAFGQWDLVSMGNPDIPSAVVDENGKQVLKINIDQPLYQAAKQIGSDALFLYQAETAIEKIVEIAYPEIGLQEYLERINELKKYLGEFYSESTTLLKPNLKKGRNRFKLQ